LKLIPLGKALAPAGGKLLDRACMNDAQRNNSASQFKSVTENAVKSITQRHLTRYWERLRADYLLPLWSQVDTSELASSRDNLCVMDVNRDSANLRYRIREHGNKLTEYYGSACAGRFLDEIMTPAALPALTDIYARAVKGGRPVYTVSPITDSKGHAVVFERLLLPFTISGSTVDVVLTSLEAISVDGAFEQLKVLEPSQRLAFPGSRCVIEAPARS
jgi:hypothetical protein